jgi:demethylmenaquinone methyltransferase/2-methoxy-6-polyprenyl-1,4-benzoquinol methylase
LSQVRRKGPSQILTPQLEPRDLPTFENRREATDDSFNLREFGHQRNQSGPCTFQNPLLGTRAMDKVSFGYEEVEPEEKSRRVRGVFSSVASSYDLMNDLMSGGQHRLWKDMFVRRLRPRPGERILDMAGGTGDIAFRMARRGAAVTVADINPDMLAVGIERAGKRGIEGLAWAEENAERLTFPASTFDAYSVAFGIRNVTDIDAALREALRVLRTGGRFFCLEFSQTRWPGFRESYRRYSRFAVPRIGRLVAGDADSYRYLVESIERFPDMDRFAAMIGKAGFSQVKTEPILGGLVAIHSGWKI